MIHYDAGADWVNKYELIRCFDVSKMKLKDIEEFTKNRRDVEKYAEYCIKRIGDKVYLFEYIEKIEIDIMII